MPTKLYKQIYNQVETTPCKFCGDPTEAIVTKMCNWCYEVEGRIDRFLKTKAGRDFIRAKLREKGDSVLARDDFVDPKEEPSEPS